MGLKHRKLPISDLEDLLAELRATLTGARVTPLMRLFRGYLE